MRVFWEHRTEQSRSDEGPTKNFILRLSHGPILSVEYTNNRPNSSPSLSNFRGIFETDKLRPAEFTFNGSYTFYNSHPADPNVNRRRDFQFSSQLDFPLANSYLGSPIVLSFAGKYERLLKDTQIPASLIATVFTADGTLAALQAAGTIPTATAKKGDIAIAW